MLISYAQLAQLVTALLSIYQKVPSLTPTEAFIFGSNFFLVNYIREVVPQSLQRVYEESMESLCVIHETVFHGVLMESSIFQTVPLDSTWTPHIVYGDYWE